MALQQAFDTEIIEALVAAGASVDPIDENGMTPLHLAARAPAHGIACGSGPLRQLLVLQASNSSAQSRRESELDQRGRRHATNTTQAAESADPGPIDALIAAGAEVSVHDRRNATPAPLRRPEHDRRCP